MKVNHIEACQNLKERKSLDFVLRILFQCLLWCTVAFQNNEPVLDHMKKKKKKCRRKQPVPVEAGCQNEQVRAATWFREETRRRSRVCISRGGCLWEIACRRRQFVLQHAN
ncbi:hypothetical protein CEXT_771151 [Caerostris extrusa]|uniref:Uncharacterized protein n=1 Tax=Caerostris extrusa TaxID=172846 RepID=A0AAV4PQY7_CAEEX|nr:hypothetical protein CEXT_771151 [Caerostris extrusa]